jgi:exodeoxyribonuclease VII small subunit
MSRKKTEPLPFEQALGELEALVERMEAGNLSLEDSLAAFEQGIALTRTCQEALAAAEQRVEILTARSVQAPTEPFEDDA